MTLFNQIVQLSNYFVQSNINRKKLICHRFHGQIH